MSFDWEMYRCLNPDLDILSLKTPHHYRKHYLTIGKKEGKKYKFADVYPAFDYVSYQKTDKNLVGLTERQLQLHYIQNSIIKNVDSKEQLEPIQQIKQVQTIKKKIYIVFSVKTGGSAKYIKNLLLTLTQETILIDKKASLYSMPFQKGDVVLVQQLLQTDIRATDLIRLQQQYRFRMMICIHDFCWLNEDIYDMDTISPHGVYLENQQLMPEVLQLFSMAETVIHPTKFSFDEYGKYMKTDNFKIIPHVDDRCDWKRIFVPLVKNVINIGVFHHKTAVKGSDYIELLMNNYKSFGSRIIQYFVVEVTIPVYKEEQYHMLISKYNIHGLFLLNKWGETWSYLLTKSLNTGLPILYNNIGAYKYRIKPDEHRFCVGQKDGYIDLCKLWETYESMLTYIVKQGQYGKIVWEQGNELEKPDFYKQL